MGKRIGIGYSFKEQATEKENEELKKKINELNLKLSKKEAEKKAKKGQTKEKENDKKEQELIKMLYADFKYYKETYKGTLTEDSFD